MSTRCVGGSDLFLGALDAAGHLQPAAPLGHQVHLDMFASQEEPKHDGLYGVMGFGTSLTGWAHMLEGRCLKANSRV